METRAAARQRLLLQIGPNPEVTREIGIIDIKKKPTPVAKRKVIPPPQPAANIQNAAHQQPRKRPRKKSRTSKKKRATTARKNTKTPTTPRVELNGPPVEHVEQPNIDDNNVALLAFLALPELEEEVDIKPPAIIKQEIERQPQIACPRCTAFNDDTLDDCVVCEAPLKCSDDGQLLAEIERIQDNCGIACNSRTIECPVCFATVPPGDGCVLHECLHEFCAECLRLAVQHSPQADVKCPYTCAEFSCASSLLAKEIRALLSGEQYEAYLCRSLGEAERQTQQEAFHCKSVDCAYWCLVDVGGWIFYCPVCQRKNCTACKVCDDLFILLWLISLRHVFLKLLYCLHSFTPGHSRG